MKENIKVNTVGLGWRVLSTGFSNNGISFREKYLDDHWKEKIIT